jgi:ribosomal protein S18 acetylase RimI-like enzyme
VQLELYNVPRPPYGVEAYIYSLFVNKLARKEGRATALLDMAERLAAENGCQSVWLEWSGKDTPIEILEWYIRRGYNLIANNDNGAKLLEKKLTPKTSAQT